MVTKVKSGVIGDNTVGITQLNVSDGSDGQVLTTNGSGTLSFSTISGYTDSDVETYLDGGTSTPTFASATVSGDLTVDTSTLKVDSTNNRVGIGTTSPSSKLHLESGTAHNKLSITSTASGGTGYDAVIDLLGSAANSEVQLNMGINGDADREQIKTYQGDMIFQAQNSERMRIYGTSGTTRILNDTGGEFAALIQHTNTSAADGNGPHGFQVSFAGVAPNQTNRYFCRMGDTGAFRFIIDSQGNVTNATNSYGQISDERLKENIVDATPKLDELMQLEIKNFNFIGDDKKQLGVIAQQVETVFPNLIDERPDQDPITNEDLGTTTKSVKYSVFVPMLIKGMQEQQTIIDALEARIETLENS